MCVAQNPSLLGWLDSSWPKKLPHLTPGQGMCESAFLRLSLLLSLIGHKASFFLLLNSMWLLHQHGNFLLLALVRADDSLEFVLSAVVDYESGSDRTMTVLVKFDEEDSGKGEKLAF